jgi:hypothetical protein
MASTCNYKLISHRGNLEGPNPEHENSPRYVMDTINRGFECEVDVWKVGDTFYLGHDTAQYPITLDFLRDERLWCHAKNTEALEALLQYRNIHCFWHEEDQYTITSKGYIWAYPGSPLTPNSICVMPEVKAVEKWAATLHKGVCSDYILTYDTTIHPRFI